MIRIALREVRSHCSRFILSIIAIALGVAFVVGSFCFRQILNNQIEQIMGSDTDADVYIRGNEPQHDDETKPTQTHSEYNLVDTDLIADINDVSGVKYAGVQYMTIDDVLIGSNGEAVATVGAPTVAIGVGDNNPWRAAHLEKGHWPKNSKEIALHSATAQASGLHVGDTTKIVLNEGPQDVTVVGEFSTSSSQAGALILALAPSLTQDIVEQSQGEPNKVEKIAIYGDLKNPLSNKEQQQLVHAINAQLPKSAHAIAVTGNSVRDTASEGLQEKLGFIQPLILIFALIALFVGSFIIANTFAMIVHDSMRGYALLRSIGASPLQIFLTVVIQALVLGVIGSIIGVLLGWGMLELIAQAMSKFGLPLTASPAPHVLDVTIGMIVGILAAIIAAAIPARTAALSPVIQAMNATSNPEKPVTLRAWIGGVMSVLGILAWMLTIALASSDHALTPWHWVNSMNPGISLGIGAALIVVGIIVLAPALVYPAGVVLGWIPSHIFSVTGRLASRNIARQKRRTANTAAALFVGVAIVSCLGVIAASAQASVSNQIDQGFHANYVIMPASPTHPIPENAVQALEDTEGVGSLVVNRTLYGVKYDGKKLDASTTAVDPQMITRIYPVVAQSGNAQHAIAHNELIVGQQVADDNHYYLGQKLQVTAHSPTIKMRQSVKIGAIVDDATYRDGIYISTHLADDLTNPTMMAISQMFVKAQHGTSDAQLRKHLNATVKDFYVMNVLNKDQYKSAKSQTINQMLAVIDALLALSIIIAIFGIVNTLALNVAERTHEIGLLRAVGTSDGQIRGMLAIESMIICVFGTLLGIALGVCAGIVIRVTYAESGLHTLAIPWGQLGIFFVLAIVVGLIASLTPAHRALKKPILEAINTD